MRRVVEKFPMWSSSSQVLQGLCEVRLHLFLYLQWRIVAIITSATTKRSCFTKQRVKSTAVCSSRCKNALTRTQSQDPTSIVGAGTTS